MQYHAPRIINVSKENMEQKNPFDYQKPTEANIPKIEALREAYKVLYAELDKLPRDRYVSLAVTNLEVSAQWAIKSLVFSQ